MKDNTVLQALICLSYFLRTKFGEYKEYHTSLDNLDIISKEGFKGSFKIMCKVLESIEINKNIKI